MAVIMFCSIAGKVLLADYKRLLISGLNLGQPSFVYAYLALLLQSGEFGRLDFMNLKTPFLRNNRIHLCNVRTIIFSSN